MAFADVTSREAVLAALRECDTLGREKFLAKYGFGEARSYVLHDGNRYDSKAIVGVAHGIQFPEKGPLAPADFSGGDATVKEKLEEMGFSVVVEEKDDAEEMALVLVEAEETAGSLHDDWKDVTGTQYHYPNQYKNRITPGRRFIYYRGIRRAGGKRGLAEYFGSGTVGDVRLDPETLAAPKKDQHWFCGIEDYVPFGTPPICGLLKVVVQNHVELSELPTKQLTVVRKRKALRVGLPKEPLESEQFGVLLFHGVACGMACPAQARVKQQRSLLTDSQRGRE